MVMTSVKRKLLWRWPAEVEIIHHVLKMISHNNLMYMHFSTFTFKVNMYPEAFSETSAWIDPELFRWNSTDFIDTTAHNTPKNVDLPEVDEERMLKVLHDLQLF